MNTAVIEHRTYVGAKCLRCRGDALRVCIVHDDCEFDHSIHTVGMCNERARRLQTLKAEYDRMMNGG